jgi:hypothetical protein
MQKYKREYDYYSLGMVLLEIGLWFPLSGLMRKHAEWRQLDAKAFADRVRREYCPQLGSFVGSVYRDVVADLLDGGSWGESQGPGEELDEQGETIPEVMQTVEFQTRILGQLGRCFA